MAFCSKCGSQLEATAQYCSGCGAAVFGDGAPLAAPKTSGAAIASLVFSLLIFVPFAPIIGIILGHVARRQIKRSNGAMQGDALALAGLIIGYLIVVFGTLLAIPMFLHRND